MCVCVCVCLHINTYYVCCVFVCLNIYLSARTHPQVLPSLAQMRRSGRLDLAHAIYRYGGSEAVAARFGLLSSSAYSYHAEFYLFLRELKAYQVATGQVGLSPAPRWLAGPAGIHAHTHAHTHTHTHTHTCAMYRRG